MRKIKHATSDFTVNNLPKTRVQVFFDKFLHQYNVFFKLGLMLLIFTIPLLISIVFKDTIKLSLVNDEGFIEEDTNRSVNIIFSLIDIVTFAILSIGLAGAFRVIRQLIWDEIIFFKDDFFKGIKNNSKSFILTSLVISIVNVIANLSLNIDTIDLVRHLPQGILLVIILPVLFISFSFNNIYNVKFIQSIKNSNYLFIKSLFLTLAFYLLIVLNILIYFIPYLLFKYLVIFIFTIFLTPIILVIWNLYSCYVFDKHINLEQYPDIYDKGLYRGEVHEEN